MNQNRQYQNFQDENEMAPVGQPVYGQQNQQQGNYFLQQPRFIPIQQMGQPVNPYFNNQPLPPMQMPQQINPSYPMNVICQCCKSRVTTVVNQESGNTTYLWAACLCLCVNNCCCWPFAIDKCLDKVHYCPNCGHNIVRKHQKCCEFISS